LNGDSASWPNKQWDVQGVLAAMTQLKQLELDVTLLPDGVVGPFSHMQQLQALELMVDEASPAVLAGLPMSLTKLEFLWGGTQQREDAIASVLLPRQPLSCSTVPALVQLTALQELHIHGYGGGGMRPAFCSNMLQLRVLHLGELYDSVAVQQLLEVVPKFSSLQSLRVCSEGGKAAALPAREFSRYSALLPPSTQHLTCLELSWYRGALLPAGSVQRMFAAGRQLPQLKQLLLGLPDDEWMLSSSDCEPDDMFDSLQPCVGSEDVRRLVSCCPALQQLWLAGVLRPGTDLSPLLQLQQLTCLVTCGTAVDDVAAGSVLAKLRGLTRLQLYCCKQLTDRGLLQLVKLRALRVLSVVECGCSDEVSREGHKRLELGNQVGA
jgi:hypothetical protein